MSAKERKKTRKPVTDDIRNKKKKKKGKIRSSEHPSTKIWRKKLQKKKLVVSRI